MARGSPFGGADGAARKTVSYYDKGVILGLLLDLRIRHRTRNRRSLDTVMRALYERYYKEAGRGWTDEEFRRVCEEVAGTGLREIVEYASTIRPIDDAKHLAYAGLRRTPPRKARPAGGAATDWRLTGLPAPGNRRCWRAS